MNAEYAVILVPSTSHAIRAEKMLLVAGITCKMIPVPRHIASDCGVCVRVSCADVEAARQTLEAAGLKIEAICDVYRRPNMSERERIRLTTLASCAG